MSYRMIQRIERLAKALAQAVDDVKHPTVSVEAADQEWFEAYDELAEDGADAAEITAKIGPNPVHARLAARDRETAAAVRALDDEELVAIVAWTRELHEAVRMLADVS